MEFKTLFISRHHGSKESWCRALCSRVGSLLGSPCPERSMVLFVGGSTVPPTPTPAHGGWVHTDLVWTTEKFHAETGLAGDYVPFKTLLEGLAQEHRIWEWQGWSSNCLAMRVPSAAFIRMGRAGIIFGQQWSLLKPPPPLEGPGWETRSLSFGDTQSPIQVMRRGPLPDGAEPLTRPCSTRPRGHSYRGLCHAKGLAP